MNQQRRFIFLYLWVHFYFFSIKNYEPWNRRNYKNMQMIIILTYEFLIVLVLFLSNGLPIQKSCIISIYYNIYSALN